MSEKQKETSQNKTDATPEDTPFENMTTSQLMREIQRALRDKDYDRRRKLNQAIGIENNNIPSN